MNHGSKKLQIVYIVGFGRSGSTLLGNTINSIAGMTHIGEFRYFLDLGILENRLCACGRRFKDCPYWRMVMSKLSMPIEGEYVDELIKLRERYSRSVHLLLYRFPPSRRWVLDKIRPYLTFIKEAYLAAAQVSGTNILVDSSKFPMYGYLLQLIPEFEVRFIHLVRDPRAVAYSWQRKKKQPDPDEELNFRRYGAIGSTIRWSAHNLASLCVNMHASSANVIVRYEDFVQDPRSELKKILQMLGISAGDLPLEDDQTLSIDQSHSIWGNSSRFNHGPVKLEFDDSYRKAQRLIDKLLSTMLSLPLLARYEYPLW